MLKFLEIGVFVIDYVGQIFQFFALVFFHQIDLLDLKFFDVLLSIEFLGISSTQILVLILLEDLLIRESFGDAILYKLVETFLHLVIKELSFILLEISELYFTNSISFKFLFILCLVQMCGRGWFYSVSTLLL